MRVRFLFRALIIFSAISVGIANADQAEDATSLVEKAVVMFKEQGSAAALKAINDPKGPFVKGDLYIFALTMDNVLVGHPFDPSSRRINLTNMMDNKGVQIFQKFKEIVEKDGSGWLEYVWAKPGQDKPSRKRSLVKKVPEENFYVGTGYYLE